jgi:trimeric autotransporter adhesin
MRAAPRAAAAAAAAAEAAGGVAGGAAGEDARPAGASFSGGTRGDDGTSLEADLDALLLEMIGADLRISGSAAIELSALAPAALRVSARARLRVTPALAALGAAASGADDAATGAGAAVLPRWSFTRLLRAAGIRAGGATAEN